MKIEKSSDWSIRDKGDGNPQTMETGADARKIDEKFQSGQVQTASWKVEENQIEEQQNLMAEMVQELSQKLNRENSLLLKQNSENRAENIEALQIRLRQTEEQLTSETDSRKRADAKVVAWKYCWDIISIMVQVIYIGIRCYVKDWLEKRGHY